MKAHTRIYFKHFGIKYNESGEHDFIKCEVCSRKAVDIHHIEGRGNNDIKNLIALCRRCHDEVHNGTDLTAGDLKISHMANLWK